jgi:hypothetical protein
MSQILTPQQMRKEAVWNQIKSILAQNNMMLNPKVILTGKGISFEIEIIDAQPMQAGTPAGGSHNG